MRPKYVEKKDSNNNEYDQNNRNTNTRFRQRRPDEQRPYTSDRNYDNQNRRPKYVEKDAVNNEEGEEGGKGNYGYKHNGGYDNRYRNKRNLYEKDESKITHYTELPSLPENKRKKPNEEDHLQRIKKIDEKKNQLKDLRRQQKDTLKNKESGTFKNLETVRNNITIGEKAEKALGDDLKKIDNQLASLNEKILGLEDAIHKLEKKATRNVDIQKMTIKQLQSYIKKLQHRIITQTLNKKQISQINSEIEKCKRLKIDNKNSSAEDETTKQEYIKEKQRKLDSMKQIKKKLRNQKHAVEIKIKTIENELQSLYQQKDSLQEEKEEFKNSSDYEKTQQIKNEILKLRDEKDREIEKYEKAVRDYEEEQKLIEYVAWASEIKRQKFEEKEKERAARQKQKFREGKKNDDKDAADPKFERLPPPHPYAKEIQSCNFLINYCERLKPVETQKNEVSNVEKVQVNVEEQIKKGVWAKEKGVQVIVPKKKLNVDEAPQKKQPRLREKNTKQVESNEITHNLEVERIFEQVKLSAPKNIDQKSLDQIIVKLNQKRQYYQSNFSAPQKEEKPSYDQDKRPKNKYEQKGGKQQIKTAKLNLALSDFPTLP